MIAQNDLDTWTLHVPLRAGVDAEALDPKQVLYDSLGREFECEVIVANAWTPRLAMAKSYGRGRVWLAGDAVHQMIPTGGYGMNTGVGDAVDLGWKLAAVLEGWGGPGLLPSYETERLPVGRGLFDLFGPGFTLLRFPDVPVNALVGAARECGLPLWVVDVRDEKARGLYERDLVLVRPDQHVA